MPRFLSTQTCWKSDGWRWAFYPFHLVFCAHFPSLEVIGGFCCGVSGIPVRLGRLELSAEMAPSAQSPRLRARLDSASALCWKKLHAHQANVFGLNQHLFHSEFMEEFCIVGVFQTLWPKCFILFNWCKMRSVLVVRNFPFLRTQGERTFTGLGQNTSGGGVANLTLNGGKGANLTRL